MLLPLWTLVATLFQTWYDNVLHAVVFSAMHVKSKSERMERKPLNVPSFLMILSTSVFFILLYELSMRLFGEDFFLGELGNKPNNESNVNKSQKKEISGLGPRFPWNLWSEPCYCYGFPCGKKEKIIPDMLTFLWPGALQFPPLIENILENWG